MPTIEPVSFYGYTPYSLRFTYDIDAEHSGEFMVRIPEPNVTDTVALESFIAAVEASSDWTFADGGIQLTAGQQITP